MPRRPSSIERNIPLFLIPHIVKRNVSTHGEELERVTVCRTGKHFYTISTRTKPVKRELRGGGNPRRARDRMNHEDAGTGEKNPG